MVEQIVPAYPVLDELGIEISWPRAFHIKNGRCSLKYAPHDFVVRREIDPER
jgi:hypothetical protein